MQTQVLKIIDEVPAIECSPKLKARKLPSFPQVDTRSQHDNEHSIGSSCQLRLVSETAVPFLHGPKIRIFEY